MELFVLVSLVVAGEWVRRSFAELRRGQAAILAELDRLAATAGLSPLQVTMLRCPRCASAYSPELTGCPTCGAAKSAAATPISVNARDVDPDVLVVPPSKV
jgi:uncharacterized OB-fold protein